MNSEDKRKLSLKRSINSLDDKKLVNSIKEIINHDIDLVYSRKLLEKFIPLDEVLEKEIKKIDDEENEEIFSIVEKDLLKRKQVVVTRQFSYSDDNGVVAEDNSFLILINRSYALIEKLIENHSYKKAKTIISLLKEITIAYEYDLEDDEILKDETNIDDFEDYDFYTFIECFNEFPYNFSIRALANKELIIALHSKNPAKGVAKLINEYAHETNFDFADIDNILKLAEKDFIEFLFAIFLEIKNSEETYSTYFSSIKDLAIDISPLLEKIYHEIGKCNEVVSALEERGNDIIIKYGQLFFTNDRENYYAKKLADLIFNSALNLKKEDIALHYLKASYSMEQTILKLVYIVALSDEIDCEEIYKLSKGKKKKHYIYPFLGIINEDILKNLVNEQSLGWSYTPLNAILTLLKYLVAKNSKPFFEENLRITFINDIYGETSMSEEYFDIYLKKMNKVVFNQEKTISAIEKMSIKRIESIVFNTYRGSYFKAASLLVDLEILNSDLHMIKTDLVALLNDCRGHPAFIKEYKAAKETVQNRLLDN